METRPMTRSERFILYNKIYSKYIKEMSIHAGDCGKDRRAYSYITLKEIVVPADSFINPSEWDIFVLLHEIGHIKTNNAYMRVFEQEYLATQWSVGEAKQWGIFIHPIWKQVFQEYIWSKREICLNHNGKNVPSKEELTIKW